jgi:hypothetical protein
LLEQIADRACSREGDGTRVTSAGEMLDEIEHQTLSAAERGPGFDEQDP